MMIRFAFLIAIFSATVFHAVQAQSSFSYRTAYTGLAIPWEIEFAYDGSLWMTERDGLLSRVDLGEQKRTVLLDLRSIVKDTNEAGMLGFTWHPDFPDSPYVYVAATFQDTAAQLYRTVDRYIYDRTGDTLVDPMNIMTYDPADIIHQGCRLMIGADRKLYITMGDSPEAHRSVIDSSLNGKVLRYNLDGTIPDDNPVAGLPMFTKGHRNVQGITQLPNGTIFTSEHGNVTDDEVNLLTPGGNYGWPYVEGPCDDEWELEYCDSAGVIDPAWATGSSTIAMSAMAYYNHDRYPSLKHSLLLLALKNSAVYQLKLNDEGTAVTDVVVHLQYSAGRLRDIALTPDGRIFLSTSNREPNAYFPFPKPDDDRVIEMILLDDGATPDISVPDTVYVTCDVGSALRFPIPVTNSGTGNAVVVGLWTMDQSVPVRGDQWRVPLTIVPATTYDVAGWFEPTEPGEYIGHVRLVVNDLGTRDIYVKAVATEPVSVRESDASANSLSVYPNPTTSATTIAWTGGFAGRLRIVDASGATVFTTAVQPDDRVRWNGKGLTGMQCPSGVYVAVVETMHSTHRCLIQLYR